MTNKQNIVYRIFPFIYAGSAQVVNSGANFLFSVLLVRVLEKEEFGLYSLGFALLLMIQNIYSAIYSTQFVVNSASKSPTMSFIKWGHYAVVHTLSGLLVILLSSGLVWTVRSEGVELDWIWLIPIATAGALAFGLRDLGIRYVFIMGRPKLVFGSALVSGCVLLVAPIVIHANGGQNILSPYSALLFYGAAQFFGFLFLMAFFPNRVFIFKKRLFNVVLREIWLGGRWHMLTSLLYTFRTQLHVYIVPIMLDLRSLADINAARLLVSPALLLIPPIYQVMQPRLVWARDNAPDTVLSRLKLILFITLIGVLIYFIVLGILYKDIVSYVYADKYDGLSGLVFFWMLVVMFMIFRNALTIFYETNKWFKELLFVNVVVVIPVLLVVVFLAWWLGSVGAVVGLVVSEMFLCTMLFLLWNFRLAKTCYR